jgi:hypothetical protein
VKMERLLTAKRKEQLSICIAIDPATRGAGHGCFPKYGFSDLCKRIVGPPFSKGEVSYTQERQGMIGTG